MTEKAASRKATLRRYYEKNKEARKAQNREWYADKAGTGYNTKKRRKRAPVDFNKEDWKWILRIYDGRCLRCGSTEDIQRDHVIPVDEGGSKEMDNLQPLCGPCNGAKKNHPWDFRRGTIVKVLGLGFYRGMM